MTSVRKRQIEHNAAGRCYCADHAPLHTATRCAACADVHRIKQAIRRESKKPARSP